MEGILINREEMMLDEEDHCFFNLAVECELRICQEFGDQNHHLDSGQSGHLLTVDRISRILMIPEFEDISGLKLLFGNFIPKLRDSHPSSCGCREEA